MPGNATNVVEIAAGAFHALALKENGTVVAWGLNTSGQCIVPAGLSNVLAIAAGWAHSTALKDDGTVVAWGDNSYEQTDVGGGLKGIKLLAAGGDHTLASAFSSNVQYQVDVSKDLLLVYNSSSTNSIWVKDYYLAHRPMVSGANTLGIACLTPSFGCPTNETALPEEFTNNIAAPIQQWLVANPTKRPQYVVLFPDIPSRVNVFNEITYYTNASMQVIETRYTAPISPSVSYQLRDSFAHWRPFIMHLNMGDTNACEAYIDKLAFTGANYSPGKLLLSASAGGYGNTNYVVDNVRRPYISASVLRSATNGLLTAGVLSSSILYLETVEPCVETVTNSFGEEVCIAWEPRPHITNAANVSGYISCGAHSSLSSLYALPSGAVKWSTNSSWYIIQTVESHNGRRFSDQGNFIYWFSANAFGGANYSNTPVGAVTHVDEPSGSGVNNSALYFGLWASGKNLAIAAWNSRNTPVFQAVGDPFVRR